MERTSDGGDGRFGGTLYAPGGAVPAVVWTVSCTIAVSPFSLYTGIFIHDEVVFLMGKVSINQDD